MLFYNFSVFWERDQNFGVHLLFILESDAQELIFLRYNFISFLYLCFSHTL